ncbi:hypothetical protein [Glutamicibacter creatinolyticus]|uniref:hypothetical protein n=1 Tax=Glutamicibacter creatinolyticus TaxID=162496 RepID=UPI0032162AE6
MRQEVKDMAASLADEQLEGFEYMSIFEVQGEYGLELTEEEAKWVLGAVTGTRTLLDPKVQGRLERLSNTVDKLADWSGKDISELVEEGYLEEGDLD